MTTTMLTNNSSNSSEASNLTEYATTYHEQTWCENSVMSISCLNQQRIRIICAFYGLHPSLSDSCGLSQNMAATGIPVCYFEGSYQIVSSACFNQTSCSINVNTATFVNDPCESMAKALFVQWSCG